MKRFLDAWIDAMPTTIILLCLAGIASLACGLVGVIADSTAWFVAAMIVGQCGTIFALVTGFIFDSRRLKR